MSRSSVPSTPCGSTPAHESSDLPGRAGPDRHELFSNSALAPDRLHRPPSVPLDSSPTPSAKTGPGWKATHGEQGLPSQIECDVAIVGTRRRRPASAELLTRAGLDVVLIEEGPLRTSSDFNQKESEAYRTLYLGVGRASHPGWRHQHHARALRGWHHRDQLDQLLPHPGQHAAPLARVYGLSDFTTEAMAPWFEQDERRLNMVPWTIPPNLNNEVLRTARPSWASPRR